MEELKITDENFKQEVLNSSIPVLVDFWAPWCMPCFMVAPVVEEIAKEYEGILKVCKVNVDQAPGTAQEYRIMGIPTLGIFKAGNIVDTIVGAVPKSEIEKKLKLYV
ncbi:MAG: thioredoxin [Candidatus Omnitrophica bacterium]|nr:thioredoxin [Candidatus Omnitrophota bacterium]